MNQPAFDQKPTRFCQCTVDWEPSICVWRVIVWDKRIERTYELTRFEAATEKAAAELGMKKFQVPEPSILRTP